MRGAPIRGTLGASLVRPAYDGSAAPGATRSARSPRWHACSSPAGGCWCWSSPRCAAAGQGLRLVFVQRVAAPRPVGGGRRQQIPLPCRVDPHAPGAGRIEGDDEGDRVCARGRAQPERRGGGGAPRHSRLTTAGSSDGRSGLCSAPVRPRRCGHTAGRTPPPPPAAKTAPRTPCFVRRRAASNRRRR